VTNGSCDRRGFLIAAAKTTAALTLADWHSAARAESRPPASGDIGLSVIDSHAHFYDPTRDQGVPWPPREDKLLFRRVLPGDYRALATARPVTGVVVVEASPWLEDNQWVLDLAAHDPFIVGFVGNLPLGTKGFAGHLKRFAANRLFRGIRLRDHPLEGALDDPAFVSDLKLLAANGLSLDLVGGAEILPFAHRLSERVPGLRIVVDHLAGVVVDGKAPPADWVRQMRRLAGKSSISFKLSGLVEGTGRSDGSSPSDVEFYRPVLDAMREVFGPERLIYASNWPVSERFAPLATVQGIVEDYFRGRGSWAREQVFSQSSKIAYRWMERAKPLE
jgi:L-fuconolactonase